MDKSLRNLISEMNDKDSGYVCFFNDGEVKEMTPAEFENGKGIYFSVSSGPVTTLLNGAERLIQKTELDNVATEMSLGLIFKKKDVDENNNLKPNARPLFGTVAYREGRTVSYLDGEEVLTGDWYERDSNEYGVMRFHAFLNRIHEKELAYDGPKTFLGLRKQILSGEPFDVSLSVFPMEKESQLKLVRK